MTLRERHRLLEDLFVRHGLEPSWVLCPASEGPGQGRRMTGADLGARKAETQKPLGFSREPGNLKQAKAWQFRATTNHGHD